MYVLLSIYPSLLLFNQTQTAGPSLQDPAGLGQAVRQWQVIAVTSLYFLIALR